MESGLTVVLAPNGTGVPTSPVVPKGFGGVMSRETGRTGSCTKRPASFVTDIAEVV